MDPIQPSNEFTMTERLKLKWVTPSFMPLESADIECAPKGAAASETINANNGPS